MLHGLSFLNVAECKNKVKHSKAYGNITEKCSKASSTVQTWIAKSVTYYLLQMGRSWILKWGGGGGAEGYEGIVHITSTKHELP